MMSSTPLTSGLNHSQRSLEEIFKAAKKRHVSIWDYFLYIKNHVKAPSNVQIKTKYYIVLGLGWWEQKDS